MDDCWKDIFLSRDEARQEIKSRQWGVGFPYQCHICGNWHISSKKGYSPPPNKKRSIDKLRESKA